MAPGAGDTVTPTSMGLGGKEVREGEVPYLRLTTGSCAEAPTQTCRLGLITEL